MVLKNGIQWIVQKQRQFGICVAGILMIMLLAFGYHSPFEVNGQPGHATFDPGALKETYDHVSPQREILQQRVKPSDLADIQRTTNQIPTTTPQYNSNFTGPIKVLLLTYMRSGSTFTGELFNQNPDTFYWFEPADGVLSHVYGSTLGVFPIDVTQYINGSDRQPPAFESRALSDAMINLLNCDVTKLPPEMSMHDFLHRRMRISAPQFVKCFDAKWKEVKAKKMPSKINECKQFIGRMCGKRGYPDWGKCHKWLHGDIEEEFNKQNVAMRNYVSSLEGMTEMQSTNLTASQMRSYLDRKHSPLLKTNFTLTPSIFNSVLDHHSCMGTLRTEYGQCLPDLQDVCSSSQARVAKTIRLTMQNIEDILSRDPSIRVLHLLRDPRAVVHSRLKAGLISYVSRRKSRQKETRLIDEAEILCHKMRKDIALKKSLEKRYPHNLKEIRYEQIAQHPLEAYRDIYDFLGMETSVSVEHWIDQSTHANKSNAAFGTMRKNSTQTAFNWETDVTYRTVKQMNKHCHDILQYLGFESM